MKARCRHLKRKVRLLQAQKLALLRELRVIRARESRVTARELAADMKR